MNKFTLILSALLMLALVVVMAPNIIVLSRGKALRNIALWLAIFLGLIIIYRTVGPGSPHPLFNLPQSMQMMSGPPAENANPANNQGYTPPKD
jgi:cytochrome c biogenesis protein CcdA